MRRFARLYHEIDSTTSTSEKLDLLEAYFREAPDRDAAVALHVLTGGRIKRALPTRVLKEAAIEASGIPGWLLGECYEAVGDFSETVALVLPAPGDPSPSALHEVWGRVVELSQEGDERRVRRGLIEAWERLESDERLVFHKLIRGGLRIGVQKRLVVRAMARVAGAAEGEMAHRLAEEPAPSAEAYRAVLDGTVGAGRAGPRPYPFYLAHQLDAEPSTLGKVEEWQVEWKWDGIRAQLVRGGGRTLVWSRGEESIGGSFPEIAGLGAMLPEGTALDGEILAWRAGSVSGGDGDGGGDGNRGRPRSFAELQTRLNRKVAPTAEPSLFEAEEDVVFMAYDILEASGRDVRGEPTRRRREILEEVVRPLLGRGPIRLSEVVRRGAWAELEELRRGSRERGVEGFMLKHVDAPYGVGRTRPDGSGGWWKWKVDPLSVDAVLVYAQAGSGRRAGLFTDYTFAVWDEGKRPRELVPFAKAYSGLTQEEIERVNEFVRGHTMERRGPIRAVEARLVFEIGFEGIRESTRHRSGVAVRFPRILRWRTDKPPDQADTLESLRRLLRATA